MEGNGMKLIMIHLLHHFNIMIQLFGFAKDFDTFIPEKNYKSKVKEHARRTRYQSIQFDYQTARKDYKGCVQHYAECKVLSSEHEKCYSQVSQYTQGRHKQHYNNFGKYEKWIWVLCWL